MRVKQWLVLTSALVAFAGYLTAAADSSSPPAKERSERAYIPFAHLGGIRDWRAVDNDTLYIEGRNDRWYRAELLGPCVGLTFETTIGFVLEPSGSFDRFSSIVADGQQCHLKSLEEVKGPPERDVNRKRSTD